MTERPILFNSQMVKAILEGRKTQTRRAVKGLPVTHDFHGWIMDSTRKKDEGKACWAIGDSPLLNNPIRARCPFGQVGDQLWIRETFGFEIRSVGGSPHEQLVFRASKPNAIRLRDCDGKAWPMKWTPSLHMPRWASRIQLEITDIRVERLQDISQSDAIAEGGPPSHPSINAVSRSFGFPDFSRSWFAQTWQSIYGSESWDSNPWVWVVEFRRLPAPLGVQQ